MTTDEMLIEIQKNEYKSFGFPYVFLSYSSSFNYWSITWRNPADFSNEDKMHASTPNEACAKAIEFINKNPKWFTRKE